MDAIQELIDIMKIAEFATVGSAAPVMARKAAQQLEAKNTAISTLLDVCEETIKNVEFGELGLDELKREIQVAIVNAKAAQP